MLLKGKHIFVVEDDAGNLAIASVYLRQQGAVVDHDRWGTQTPQVIMKKLPVDVVLMDLMFPNNVSGFDVAAQIRAVPELAHIPIIAVSASDPDVAMLRCMREGFSGFIAKPITGTITKHVADVLAGKKIWITDTESYML